MICIPSWMQIDKPTLWVEPRVTLAWSLNFILNAQQI
jgi:hypothetical protein